MPKPTRRKNIPDRVKLQVALRAMGLELQQVQWDHAPPLALREWDQATGDTIPPANDPVFIQMLTIAEHAEKTFGRGGEKRATTAGSDIHAIAKTRRLTKQQQAFRDALLAKTIHTPGERPRPKSRIPSRPFPKRSKP